MSQKVPPELKRVAFNTSFSAVELAKLNAVAKHMACASRSEALRRLVELASTVA